MQMLGPYSIYQYLCLPLYAFLLFFQNYIVVFLNNGAFSEMTAFFDFKLFDFFLGATTSFGSAKLAIPSPCLQRALFFKSVYLEVPEEDVDI